MNHVKRERMLLHTRCQRRPVKGKRPAVKDVRRIDLYKTYWQWFRLSHEKLLEKCRRSRAENGLLAYLPKTPSDCLDTVTRPSVSDAFIMHTVIVVVVAMFFFSQNRFWAMDQLTLLKANDVIEHLGHLRSASAQ